MKIGHGLYHPLLLVLHPPPLPPPLPSLVFPCTSEEGRWVRTEFLALCV